MSILPNEIIDKIIIYSRKIESAINLNNKYVISKIYDPTLHTWNWAALNGKLELINKNNSKDCSICVMDHASMNGHLDVVKWLHTNRFEG